MADEEQDALTPDWPLFGLRLRSGDITLRVARERDLPWLAAMQPLDYEHDPRPDALPGQDIGEHRRRLALQDYWRSLGCWSTSSWCLTFVVEYDGSLVGVQSLEAEDFLRLRTVDTGSWLVTAVRGQGLGIAMRAAVLGLAFDHLGALAAVTSARTDNAASLDVSRHIGYRDNGLSLNASGTAIVELKHLRLTADDWRAADHSRGVSVRGLEPCLPWFGHPG